MKERLTGAIILVAVLVLLVPELLTGPSPSSAAKPAEPEGAPMRSYTIDLADNPRARPGAAAPTAAESVSEEPVEPARVEPEAGEAVADENAIPDGDAVAAASESGPATAGVAEDTPPGTGARMGSGADAAAAGANTPNASGAASAEAEQPRSAFGPGAVERQPPPTASSETPARQGRNDAAARAAGGATSATAAGESAGRQSGSDAPAKPAANEATARRSGNESPAPRASTSKGWAVQLGVFASRENAERLAKQVKAKGYPVVVNETSGNKRLYRVRVGPAPDRAAAVQLGEKLRAAGHAGAVVAFP